ncbi:MAG: hypothetical protein JST33_00575 [Actinobacteria bacterium]|nr:hypothetical protein [Actinomycetota bacterium]
MSRTALRHASSTFTLTDGTRLAAATDGRTLAAVGIDLLVMLVVPPLVFFAVWRGQPDMLSAALLTAMIVWPVFAFGYGICGIGGRAFGALVTGTRYVLVPSGRSPGPWRRGWTSFRAGVFVVLIIATAFATDATAIPGGSVRKKRPVDELALIDLAASRALDLAAEGLSVARRSGAS